MKVLFINAVCGTGSTGKICAELAEKYEKDGERRTFTKINANKVQFLDSKKDKQAKEFTPHFNPTGLNIYEFEAFPF